MGSSWRVRLLGLQLLLVPDTIELVSTNKLLNWYIFFSDVCLSFTVKRCNFLGDIGLTGIIFILSCNDEIYDCLVS